MLKRFGITEYREGIIAPYRLIYRIREQTVQVLLLADGRRSLEELLLERFIDNN